MLPTGEIGFLHGWVTVMVWFCAKLGLVSAEHTQHLISILSCMEIGIASSLLRNLELHKSPDVYSKNKGKKTPGVRGCLTISLTERLHFHSIMLK